SGVYLSRTSDTAGLKELLGGVGVASGGQPDRGTAEENLSRYGQVILRKSRGRAEALKLGWTEDAPVEARAQSTVLLSLGYLTGWPDALAGYTLAHVDRMLAIRPVLVGLTPAYRRVAMKA
ncbi:hypothetical protein FOZ62_018149, partial [Perkinsus olseni]